MAQAAAHRHCIEGRAALRRFHVGGDLRDKVLSYERRAIMDAGDRLSAAYEAYGEASRDGDKAVMRKATAQLRRTATRLTEWAEMAERR